jgi:uncharacterized protein (UPF0332 family)
VTEAEKIAALVRYRLEQADEALAAADLNLSNDLRRSAINRAYYAMFYAALALLASRLAETSKHSAAIAQFDLLFVKSGLLPRDLSRWLHSAFLQRQAADYGADVTSSSGEVSALLANAGAFVAAVREHLAQSGDHRHDT